MRGNTPGAPPLHRLPVLTEVVQLSDHERLHEPVLSEWPDQDFLPEPELALASEPQWREPEPEPELPPVQAAVPVAQATPVAAPVRPLTPAAVWAAATQAAPLAPVGVDDGRTAPLRPGIPPILHTVVMPAPAVSASVFAEAASAPISVPVVAPVPVLAPAPLSASLPAMSAPPVLPLHSEVRSTPTVAPAPAAPPSFASSWWTEDDEAAFPPPSIRAGVQPVQPEGWAAAVPSYTSPLTAAYPSAPVPPMVVTPPPPPPAPPLPTEEQLVQRVLSGLDRQLSLVFEQQLVEVVVPALARASEALVSELRTELAQTLHDMVQHAVAVELARHAPSRK